MCLVSLYEFSFQSSVDDFIGDAHFRSCMFWVVAKSDASQNKAKASVIVFILHFIIGIVAHMVKLLVIDSKMPPFVP